MRKEAIVHIGLHKTGTTSIQQFAQDNVEAFQYQGIDFYQGVVMPQNHVELHAAAMRPERESGYKNRSGLAVDDAYIQFVKERVAKFVRESKCPRVLFSNEGLSLLRYPDELRRLREIFSVDLIKVIVFLRDPHSYLSSYAKEIRKDPRTMPLELTKESFAYTGPDSWLIDYKQRMGAFESEFGPKNIHVIDYDKEVALNGSVIPAFLGVMSMVGVFAEESWSSYRLNQNSSH